MNYSEKDLDVLDADLVQAERRRDWMSGVATTLKAKNQPAEAAERQHAKLAATAQAMKELRSKIEKAIIAQRRNPATD